MTILASLLIVVGSGFCCLAALGVLRFPDVFTRLHASAKAGPLGSGLILLGAGVASGDLFTLARCVLGMLFLLLVSPVSAHLLGRAALKSGVRPASITSINEFDDSP